MFKLLTELTFSIGPYQHLSAMSPCPVFSREMKRDAKILETHGIRHLVNDRVRVARVAW